MQNTSWELAVGEIVSVKLSVSDYRFHQVILMVRSWPRTLLDWVKLSVGAFESIHPNLLLRTS